MFARKLNGKSLYQIEDLGVSVRGPLFLLDLSSVLAVVKQFANYVRTHICEHGHKKC